MDPGVGLRGVLSSIGDAAKFILVLALSIVIAYMVRLAIERRIMKTLPRHVAVPLVRAIYYTIVFLGGVAALSMAGVNLSGLLLAGGIAGIILGFASQTVISNLLSGMFLYLDRPFTVGDAVELGGVSGIVDNITIFSTRVRRWDGVIARIPNEEVFKSTILNPYQNPIRRFEHQILLAHVEDIDRAISIALNVLEEDSMVLVKPGPEAFISSINENGVVLVVRGWAPSRYWYSTMNRVLYNLKARFGEAGIRIAIPQRIVWIKEEGDNHPHGS
ncbi:MAG: mechanosensitive ion channel family protein [Desulfurococcales archaeon]|nr:mechanosensitive ion channel family protein [Desulfurococcales archaeon]